MRWIQSLFILLFLIGCAKDPHASVVQWSNSLQSERVLRWEKSALPTLEEQTRLLVLDHQASTQIEASGRITFYNEIIRILKNRVGIDPRVEILVMKDFRSHSSYRGGIALYQKIYLEGKFLDILQEYSYYLVLFEAGKTELSRGQALDRILSSHMAEYERSVDPLYFTFQEVSALPQGIQRARSILLELMGAQLYHEFGHYYLSHSLEKFRAQNHSLQGSFLSEEENLVLSTSWNEDSADRIAGMLSKKAGHSLSFAREWLEILAFYGQKESQPYLSFSDFMSLQEKMIPSHQYSSLAVRKSLLEEGFRLFAPN